MRTSRSARAAGGAAALVLLLAVAGCESATGPATGATTATTATGPSAVSQAATPSPTPTPYAQSLARWIAPVGQALGRAASAKDLDTLATRLDQARTAADEAADGLQGATPPGDAAQPHRDLVAALGRLSTDLADVQSGISDRHYCATSSALAGLGAAKGLQGVTGAVRDLAAAGYRASFQAPRTGRATDRRAANGEFIRSGGRTGRGELTVQNGGDADAVLSLARGKHTVDSVYVRKGRSYTVRGVRDGTYTIYFTSGSDWDGDARRFTRDCGFSRFDETMTFTTTRTSTEIRWTTWKITLQPVLGGNTTTSAVDAGSYPQP